MNWLDVFGSIDSARGGEAPIYARIVEAIRVGIQSGQLPDNLKLPTNRELSALLGIDRSTVSRAYLELERLGLAESHVGRGTFVRLSGLAATGSEERDFDPTSYPMGWADKFSRAGQTAFSLIGRQIPGVALRGDAISFAGGIPTQEFLPEEEFQDIVSYMNRAGRSQEMFAYSPAEGHSGLKDEVRRLLNAKGMNVTDEELLILSGSQQAIDIVAKAFIDPGDVVVVEDPTYLWANCIFAAAQARCIPVATDEEGMRTDLLEGVLSRQRVKLIYVMPTFQNPTGATLPLSRRKKLLDLAARYQVPVLEDNFVGDLRYDGDELPTLRALDKSKGIVIHQGTFSKALCPGLRLGWIIAPSEVMVRLSLIKRACDLSTNSMSQAVMAEYLRRGHYERHLDVVKSAYRIRRDTMCDALSALSGPRLAWSRPDGGLFVWVRLPQGFSARELVAFAEREGVTFSPGDTFFINGDRDDCMRLSFIQLEPDSIREGIARLGRALASYAASRLRADRSHENAARGSETALI